MRCWLFSLIFAVYVCLSVCLSVCRSLYQQHMQCMPRAMCAGLFGADFANLCLWSLVILLCQFVITCSTCRQILFKVAVTAFDCPWNWSSLFQPCLHASRHHLWLSMSLFGWVTWHAHDRHFPHRSSSCLELSLDTAALSFHQLWTVKDGLKIHPFTQAYTDSSWNICLK